MKKLTASLHHPKDQTVCDSFVQMEYEDLTKVLIRADRRWGRQIANEGYKLVVGICDE